MSVFEELEEKFPEIVSMMADKFNSHEFILKLAQKYQRLYVEALCVYADNDQPFQTVHGEIAKRLKKYKKHKKLVEHIGNAPSSNIFGLTNDAAVWEKVKE